MPFERSITEVITISLCMIIKDEEDVLDRCLQSVCDLVDEINIVDTGSKDKSIEIANKYTNRVFHFPWNNSFADARNESFKHATKDYIFYMDADDVLLKSDRENFKQMKETLDPSTDAVSMYYHAGVDEFNNVTLKYRRNRLVKRARNFIWKGKCHNYLEVSGKILDSDIAITHLKEGHSNERNLQIYKDRIKRKEAFSPRDYFYYGNELRENGYHNEAIDAYIKRLAQKDGWKEEKIFSAIFKADCYRLIQEEELELSSLLEALTLSLYPRAEITARIGFHYQQRRYFIDAILWYMLALRAHQVNDRGLFYPPYYTWYPHQQLCICFYNLQLFEDAYYHNEKALKFRQDDLLLFHKEMLKKFTKNKSRQ